MLPGELDWKEKPYPHYCQLNWTTSMTVWIDREGAEYYCECQITDAHVEHILRYLQRKNVDSKSVRWDGISEFGDDDWGFNDSEIDEFIKLFQRVKKTRQDVKSGGGKGVMFNWGDFR